MRKLLFMELISPLLRQGFREFCVSYFVLRQINDLFTMAGVKHGNLPPDRVVSGERRTLVEEYYSSIAWDQAEDAEKFLKVLGYAIAQQYAGSDEPRQRLRSLCVREGLSVNGIQVSFRPNESKKSAHEATESEISVLSKPGSTVFIGHGRSLMWMVLKDFIEDRLHLQVDEFNREPVAGRSTIARLSEMLNNVSFAFIVMTAEDEHKSGELHARANVIHEAGLFQGRLGFQKAIILLEEGCTEFSNIHGLNQIRFPKDNISASFEEIRRVLERERFLARY